VSGPLDELLVVDLCQAVAGGYCCLLLRYLGADIIKAEPPRSTKGAPRSLDTGKKSITLDLSRPEGAALLRRLAEQADVLVTDAPLPANLDREALSRQNPRLIVTSLTGALAEEGSRAHLIGLNAFAATVLPLVNMAVLGRGQLIEVDAAECLAAAAMVVDETATARQPVAEASTTLTPPFRMDGLAPLSPPPEPGEHNHEVYCALLGLSGEELERLKREGIV
jgi:crotonobetainyl-CoA:carnitine CoA-transferase CaiB-like acyl-CoA transferase